VQDVPARVERREGPLAPQRADATLHRPPPGAAAGLQAATESLNVLLEDVRANPRKYINLEIF
jgi:hypothetical protein